MLSKPILQVKGLTKIYGGSCPKCLKETGPNYNTNVCPYCGSVVACNDVGFELYQDEVLGVVGESGSGKSTLLKILHFDIDAFSGEIYLSYFTHNNNLFLLSPFRKRQIRNAYFGIVYQNPYIGLRMNISSGGNIAERLLMASWRNVGNMRERASELLDRTEIPVARIDEPPKNFSGGMQQRVQIAKALSNNPVVLFLDEITTGLDLSVQARVLDLIRNLQRELKISIIVVTHDLGVIRLLASRTVVMKYGKIVEIGLTDQILEDPKNEYTQLLVSSQL